MTPTTSVPSLTIHHHHHVTFGTAPHPHHSSAPFPLSLLTLIYQEITRMSADLTAITVDLASLKSTMSTIHADVGSLVNKIDSLSAQVAELQAAGTGATAEQIAALDAQIREVLDDGNATLASIPAVDLEPPAPTA